MRLSDASVVIRPRNAWEAMDLGVLLSQQHRRLLMTSWALVTLPVFVLLSLMFWDTPSTALLLFWWLKPAFDRLPLFILSKALFGETPSLRQALRQWPRLLGSQLLASLTWRRFSLSRSFVMPVVQLEGLGGQARQRRLHALQQHNTAAARWLTLIGVHLEGTLWIGLMVLFYLLLPQQIELDWSWQTLILAAEQDWRWLEHLTNGFYALILILWEPVYVACGFSLYLNRRTELEAWDIELVLRRLRQRLSGVAALLILAGLTLLPMSQPAWAAPATAPDSPRLLEQPLTSQASKDSIQALLKKPPFKNPQTVTRYRFGEDQAEAATDSDDKAPGWLKALASLFDSRTFGIAAKALEILLWGLMLGALALLLWYYRDGLQAFVGRRQVPDALLEQAPPQLFGLDVRPDTLPEDVAASAEHLWQSQPREALGLLYRALLSRLLDDFQLPLKPANTEGQVLELIQELRQPALQAFSASLTLHWQNMAYGHRLPPAHLRDELCNAWRTLFGPGATP